MRGSCTLLTSPLAQLSRLLSQAAAYACLTASLFAADLTVGPVGTGAQYNEISAAVSAAVPGDQVFVAPGTYSAFDVDKPLKVIGAGHQFVVVESTTSAALRISNLAPNEVVHVTGMTLQNEPALLYTSPNLELTQNDGSVTLSDVYSSLDFTFAAPVFPTVSISDCTAVLLDGCDISSNVASPLQVSSSSVWLTDSRVTQARHDLIFTTSCGALEATDSELTLARTTVTGGIWTLLGCTGFCPGPGTSAVCLTNSTLQVSGGPGNGLFGGLTTSFAVFVDATSTVRAAADALVTSGGGQPGYLPQPGSTVTLEPYPLPTADFLPNQATHGESVALSVTGTSGSTHFAFHSPTIGPPTQHPALTESLVLTPANLILLSTIPVASNGAGVFLTDIPPWPIIPRGTTVVVQTLELSTQLLLSNPTVLTIR